MSTFIRVKATGNEDWTAKALASAAGISTGVTVALQKGLRTSYAFQDGAVAAMTGGDLRLSNYPREGGNASIKTKGGVRSGAGVGTAAVGFKGPLPIVENDVNAHMIGFGKGSKARSRIMATGTNVFSGYAKSKVSKAYGGSSNSRKLLKINGSVVTAPVRHPGTTGKGIWKKTRDGPLRAALPKVMRAPITTGAMGPWR